MGKPDDGIELQDVYKRQVQNAYLNQDTSLTCAPGTAERVDAAVLKLLSLIHIST